MGRQLFIGAALLALLVALFQSTTVLEKRAAVEAATNRAPSFEVDPLWPKPMPNGWILGQTIGVAVDAQDHVWIVHRARHARSQRGARDDESADREMLRAGSAGSRIRSGRATWSHTGAARDRDTTGRSRITESPSITKATSGSAATGGPGAWRGSRARRRPRPGRKRRKPGRRHPRLLQRQHGSEVHPEWKLPDADRQARPEQRQQRRREPSAAGQDLRRQDGQRSVRRRWIRQPSRDCVRRRDRQVQASLGRLWQQAR